MTPTFSNQKSLPSVYFVTGLFFFSGFISLSYQVIWMRHLALFFGSDVYSAAISLSAFMGGLSLGSYIIKNYVDRLKNHLLYYGLIELAIGLYALFFSDFLFASKPFLTEIYQDYYLSSPAIYQGFRILIAVTILILPTTFMGATLPLIVKIFVKKDSELGRYSGHFYSVNTFGALMGTVIAAFFLLPFFGVSLTTNIAITINILVGIIAIILNQGLSVDSEPSSETKTDSGEEVYKFNDQESRTALIAIFFSGLAALALEVVLVRTLTLSFSTTVYSFPVMLSCFLFGIFYGSNNVSKTIDSKRDIVSYFGFLEITIGLSVMVLGLLTYLVPSFFGKFLWLLNAVFQNNFGLSSVISKFFVSGLLIVFPAILLGATFPVAVKICSLNAETIGHGTGRVYAANTAGGILGSLLAGFIFIPVFGSRNSFIALGFIFIAIGLYILFQKSGELISQHTKQRAVYLTIASFVIGVGILLLPRQTVMNYNLQSNDQPELIYHGEGTAHTIDIVRGQKQNIIMMVDGNIEADTSFTQRRHFVLKSHLPLLLHNGPSDVAVLGLGLGITLSSIEKNPEARSISLIELNPQMVEAHQYLDEVTEGVLRKKKVNLRIDDGRNFFSMTDQKFDMITADPIHPRISGVGFLYTEEYYQMIKKKLKKGGVVCQWMPMYNISKKSFDVAFRTFANVFKNSSFWYVRGHGLFVASLDEVKISYSQIEEKIRSSKVKNDLASIEIDGVNDFLAHLLMGPKQIKDYLGSLEDNTVNTDDNAFLEYHTPHEFTKRTIDIVSKLVAWAGYGSNILTDISTEDRLRFKQIWKKRNAQILTELNQNLS